MQQARRRSLEEPRALTSSKPHRSVSWGARMAQNDPLAERTYARIICAGSENKTKEIAVTPVILDFCQGFFTKGGKILRSFNAKTLSIDEIVSYYLAVFTFPPKTPRCQMACSPLPLMMELFTTFSSTLFGILLIADLRMTHCAKLLGVSTCESCLMILWGKCISWSLTHSV